MADTPWSEGYYNHCDPVPVCKVRAGVAVVVLTPVLVRDTCLGVSISTYYIESVAVVMVTHGQGCIYISIHYLYII